MQSGEILEQWQAEHVRRIIEAFRRSPGILDSSRTGDGKTTTTSCTGRNLGYPIIGVCPPDLIPMWQQRSALWGYSISNTDLVPAWLARPDLRSYGCFFYSIDGWGGNKNHSPRHGWLRPTNIEIDKKSDEDLLPLAPSPELQALIEEGILFVVDEAESIKNNSARTKAVRSVIRAICESRSQKSRFLLLSATPIDGKDEKQIVTLLRNFGFIRQRNLYWVNPITKEVKTKGLEQLLTVCRHFNTEKTEAVMVRFGRITKHNAGKICEALLIEVLKEHVMRTMNSPDRGEFESDMKAAYLNIENEEDKRLITEAIAELKTTSRWNEALGEVGEKRDERGIQDSLIKLQTAKAADLCRYVHQDLQKVPGSKAIIMCDNHVPLERMRYILGQYNPIVISGKMADKKERSYWIEVFNKDPTRRIIMFIMQTCIGKNLHDTVGDSPRTVYIMPSYYATRVHQAAGRVSRVGVKSKSRVRIIFCGIGKTEMNILDSLYKKCNQTRYTIEDSMQSKIKFPSEYEAITVDKDGKETPKIAAAAA